MQKNKKKRLLPKLKVQKNKSQRKVPDDILSLLCDGFSLNILIAEPNGNILYKSKQVGQLGFKGSLYQDIDESCVPVIRACMEGLTHMDECVGKLNLMLDDELITHEAQFLKRNGLVYIFLKPKAFKEAISSETIQEKLASMIRLSNGIAHNLRSPLMTLMNIADYMSLFLNKWHEMYNHDHKNCPFLIKQAEMNSILLQMQEDMMSNIVMMSDIINSLKIYGKTDRLNEYQTIDIVDLIGNVSKMVEYNAKVEVEIKIKCNLRGNRQLYCIPSDMQVVFVNLFENAIDQIQTSRKDGIIEITVTHHKDSIQIKMRDNGGGIPKDLLTTNQLFEPFATKKIGGTGLGLHSCFKIIKEHRGNIYARNHKAKMGAGAEFLIVLPIDWRRHNDRVR